MKEEFKQFVKKNPGLITFVDKGEMTWQKFYELWYLYGEDEAVWKKYISNETDSFNFNNIISALKKVNMDDVKKGVNNMQKAIELLQGLVVKDNKTSDVYEPRKLFRKFED